LLAGTYVPSTMDFPIINGDKGGGGSVLGFGFTNPYDLPGEKAKNPCRLVTKEGFINPYDLPGKKVFKNPCSLITKEGLINP
jgi:hypothetical protein